MIEYFIQDEGWDSHGDTVTTNEFDSEVYKNILFVESNKYTILSNKSSI